MDRRDLERMPGAIEVREKENLYQVQVTHDAAIADVSSSLASVADQAKANREMQMQLEQQLKQQQLAADQLKLLIAQQSAELEKNAHAQNSAIHEAGVQTMLVSEQHSNVEVTLAGRIELL